LKLTLSDFAARYPHPENPANAIIGQPTRFLGAAATSPRGVETTSSNETNASSPATSTSDERVKQLELAVQRLLAKVEQKDAKLKKYEDYYNRQKAKTEERRKISNSQSEVKDSGAAVMQASPIATGNMPAFAVHRRQPAVVAKHPSTLTLETSIQRNQTKNSNTML
jgi:hypothetical protein